MSINQTNDYTAIVKNGQSVTQTFFLTILPRCPFTNLEVQMTPMQRLDDLIHKNLMNPTFVWVQKQFHLNRFQLIKWFSIAFEIVLILEICLVDKQLDRKILDVIIAGIFLLYILRCLPLLSSISKEFEETGTYKLPKEFDV